MFERPIVRRVVSQPTDSLVVGPADMPLADFLSLDSAELLR